MTAIAGCWNLGGQPGSEEACRRMLASQKIYGPDDVRQASGTAIAMGRNLYRRLPEDTYDRQPLTSADGRLMLVADLRIDNRDDLVSDLRLEGASRLCDAAILLACLERWGDAAVERIIGDFAFALWNADDQSLTLARDFLGNRPLHYHRGQHFFAFASMPKGLHALPDIPYAPDEQMMAEFVTLLPVAGTRSFFAGVERVEPGHITTVTRDGIASRRYWRPTRQSLPILKAGDFVEGLRHQLDLATKARLRGADGMVGAHLSAGYDSGAVTATAARLLAPEGGRVTAFTSVPRAGYDGPAPKHRLADEGDLAGATAAMHPNIDHVRLPNSGRSPLDDFDRNFFLFDQPSVNPCNMVWITAINQAARDRRIGVMLTGSMGNYTISYSGHERLSELAGRGRFIRLVREIAALRKGGGNTAKSALANAIGPYTPKWLWQWVQKKRGQELDVLEYSAISPERLEALDLDRLARERDLDFTYRPRKTGFETRLWALRRVDVGNFNKGMLAGWGMDFRDPTADRRLVEYCLALPMDQFLRDGELRWIARRAWSDRLPATVLDAPLKGFQNADWHEGLNAGRAGIAEEMERIAACAPASRALDLDRLSRLAADWPDSGWEREKVMSSYRLAMLRGVSAGHFLRKASGSNA